MLEPEGRVLKETDITVRSLAGRLVDELAKGLGIAEDAKVYRTITSLPATSRDADHACYVVELLVRYFLHVEIQLELEADTGFRVFEYASRLHASGSHALPEEQLGGTKKGEPIPVRSVVLVLTGSKRREGGMRKYCWQHPSGESSVFEYEVLLVYKMTMAELLELPCFFWVFLPLAVDATRATLLPHLHRVQNLINSEPDPERKRRLAEISVGLSVVAHHHKDATLESYVASFFREEIMTCEWYRNAVKEGFDMGVQRGIGIGIEEGIGIGIEKGKEQTRQSLLDTARRLLPPKLCAALASITDVSALHDAIWEAYEARAQ